MEIKLIIIGIIGILSVGWVLAIAIDKANDKLDKIMKHLRIKDESSN